MRKLISVGSFASIIMGLGCHPGDQRSGLHHKAGELSMPNKAAMWPCQELVDPQYAQANAYLERLMHHIMDSSPEAFKGAYERSAFRVSMHDDSDPPNAYADQLIGFLSFSTSLMRSMPHDAALAGVMAHELAHITMNQADREKSLIPDDPELARIHDERRALEAQAVKVLVQELEQVRALFQKTLRLDESLPAEDFKSIRSKVGVKQSSILSIEETLAADDFIDEAEKEQMINYLAYAIGEYFGKLLPLLSPFPGNETVQKLAADMEAILARKAPFELQAQAKRNEYNELLKVLQAKGKLYSSWREIEADEVGYEFYLKAGFKAEAFTWFFEDRMRHAETPEERLEPCLAMIAAGEQPPVGLSSHPGLCWRVHNIKRIESRDHASDYKELMDKANTLTLFPGELEAVQKSL